MGIALSADGRLRHRDHRPRIDPKDPVLSHHTLEPNRMSVGYEIDQYERQTNGFSLIVYNYGARESNGEYMITLQEDAAVFIMTGTPLFRRLHGYWEAFMSSNFVWYTKDDCATPITPLPALRRECGSALVFRLPFSAMPYDQVAIGNLTKGIHYYKRKP